MEGQAPEASILTDSGRGINMSSIPLAALSVRPPEPVDIVTPYAKAMQLRQLAAQQQLLPGQLEEQRNNLSIQKQQIAQNDLMLQSKQAMQKTISEWEPSKDNIEDFPTKAAQNGVLPQDITPFVNLQQSLTKNKVENLDFMQKKHSIVSDGLESVLSLPDNQLAQGAMSKLQELSGMGAIDGPTAAQMEQAIKQQSANPASIRQTLQQVEKSQGLYSQMLDYAQKQAALWKPVQGTGMFFNPTTGETKTPAGNILTPAMMESKYIQIQQAKNMGQALTPDDEAFVKAYQSNKTPVQPTKNVMVNGKLHVMERNPSTGQYSIDRGETAPTYAMVAPSLRTVDVIDPKTGLPTVQTLSGTKIGTSATGAYGHEAAQAGIVQRAGADLISDIQANREKIGTLTAWVKKYGLNTPIADPTLAKLQAELGTFAALQPAMHGFRGTNAIDTFQNIIGGLQKNPDATIASIQGILRTAGAINPGASAQGGGPAASKAAGAPAGATHTGVGSVDKKKHWLDANGKDLGLAE